MSVNSAKAFVGLAALVLSSLLTGCAASPIECAVTGLRVDHVFDRVETPSIATIVDDEQGTCESGEKATAMRQYKPDPGTPPADVAAALTETLIRTGWTDITQLADAGSPQRTYATTIDARSYVATLDDSQSEIWLYLSAA